MLYPEVSYKCSLTPEEAGNLSILLSAKRSLWCDIVCINQADPYDKMEQIPLMGALYLSTTTLIVGSGFAKTLPPDDYLFRAWCIQEREYGTIECNWDFNLAGVHMDNISLRMFVYEVLRRIPILSGGRGVKMDLSRHNSHGENFSSFYEFVRWYNLDNEPINEMTEDKIATLSAIIEKVFSKDLVSIYPDHEAPLAEVAKDLIVSIKNKKYDENDMSISKCFLRIRELIASCLEVDPVTCQYRVFDSQSSLTEDRLYAAWGVPMWMRKEQKLPYPDHEATLKLIFKSFPTAEFALYRREHKYVQFTYFTEVGDLMLNFLTDGQRPAKEYLCSYHEFDISRNNNKQDTATPSESKPSVVVAVNDHCVGVGLKDSGELENSRTEMWVVFNKNVLKYVLDSEVDQFCRYCFMYMLYEVGLFNDENLDHRTRLFKFCAKL
jgi:hypothetical protein